MHLLGQPNIFLAGSAPASCVYTPASFTYLGDWDGTYSTHEAVMAALSAANMDENGDGVTGQNDPTTADDDDRQMSITALQDKEWVTARLTKMVAPSPGAGLS